jgi:hypothetical protein
MRTTLDIDDDVLQAAKELGRAEKKTAGQVISDLARKALSVSYTPQPDGPAGPAGTALHNGWYVRPARGGVVTSELVKRLIEESELDDLGYGPRK